MGGKSFKAPGAWRGGGLTHAWNQLRESSPFPDRLAEDLNACRWTQVTTAAVIPGRAMARTRNLEMS
jgi:hypothetical protein